MMAVHFASFRPAHLLGSLLLGLGGALLAAAPACSSDNTPVGAGGSSGMGGSGGDVSLCGAAVPAAGTDDQCTGDGGPIMQEATTCPSVAGDAAVADTVYPDPHNGTAAPDDDCKYNVTYGVECTGGATTFSITLTSRVTPGMPLTGADPQIEALLGVAHPLPNPLPVTTEVGNGMYKISGVHFDMMGKWMVRFHFFETCLDTEETSKHAHVSFWVNVP